MAIIKRSLIHPSGTSGDYVFRQRNGKTIMYTRPVKQKVSQSFAAKSARAGFGSVTRFAVFVNYFPYLKLAWKKTKAPGSKRFQRIIKSNARLTNYYGISIHNSITPEGFFLPPFTALLSENKIIINFSSQAEDLKDLFRYPFMIHLIFYFYGPKRKSSEPYCFHGMVNEIRDYCYNDSFNFTFSLDETIKQIIKKYKNVIIYTAVVLTEPGAKKIFWTSSQSSEFTL